MQGQYSSGTRLHLNGLIPAQEAQESAADGSQLILPTRERYHGPIDLDELAAARARDINATWMASEGTVHSLGAIHGLCTGLYMPAA